MNVLIVEADNPIAEMTGDLISRRGAHVRHASTIQQANRQWNSDDCVVIEPITHAAGQPDTETGYQWLGRLLDAAPDIAPRVIIFTTTPDIDAAKDLLDKHQGITLIQKGAGCFNSLSEEILRIQSEIDVGEVTPLG